MNLDNDLEKLMAHLGDFGAHQWGQHMLALMSAVTAGIHMLSLLTVAAVPNHRCLIPDVDNATRFLTADSPGWASEQIREWIPTQEDGSLDSCHYYQQFDKNSSLSSCNKYLYDNTYYKSSLAIEWDLVCDRRWYGAVTHSSYMAGVLVGAIVLGSLADRLGRKRVFYVSVIMQTILGVGVAFCENYYLHLVLRFLLAIFGSAGAYLTAFVLSMELIGSKRRTICGISFQAAFAFGIMLVALWGYLIPNYVWLQVVYGLHGTFLLAHWWLLDESPRWLWSRGRVQEAVRLVERGLERNRVTSPAAQGFDAEHYISRGIASQGKREPKTYGIFDMLKTPNLRIKTLNICLCWFANSILYYGLSMNTSILLGNPYFMLFLSAVVEMPSYVLTTLIMDKTGRRSLTSALMIIGAISCLISVTIPQEPAWGSIATTAVVMFGKFCISGSFAVIYIYSAELFPTVVRNTALGLGSMCARLAAAMTPLISLLDSFGKTVPLVIFATLALISGLLTLLLPETLGHPMPQTLEDGENFGKGDIVCCGGSRKSNDRPDIRYEIPMGQKQTD